MEINQISYTIKIVKSQVKNKEKEKLFYTIAFRMR
jgi:hypothetical protein